MRFLDKKPEIVIEDIKSNSFVVDINNKSTLAFPTKYKLSIYDSTEGHGHSTKVNGMEVSLPYHFVNDCTGDSYDVFLEVFYENYNSYIIDTEVRTIFVPIEKIESKEKDLVTGLPVNSLTIELPQDKGKIYGRFSNEGLNVIPNLETSAGVEGSASNGNFDGGYRKFCIRALSGDIDCISVDGEGYIMPKKRGEANLKISKYDERDLFEPLNLKIEVVQNPTSIVAEANKINLKRGTSTSIPFTVLPRNANPKPFLYSSNSPNVVVDDNGIITGNNIGKAIITIAVYSLTSNGEKFIHAQTNVEVNVYDDTKPQWTYIYSAPKYINAEFYNNLSINANIVYDMIKDKFPMIQHPSMQFNQVSIYASFREVTDSISQLFKNVSILSKSDIAGFKDLPDYSAEFKRTMTAPNNKMWNELIDSLNQMKFALPKG